MSKNILVTGGTGFVGSHFVPALLKTNCQVYLLCRNQTVIPFESENLHIVRCTSIAEYDGSGLPESIHTIVHMAGLAHASLDESQRTEYEDVNVRGTQTICELARQKSVQHFIFLSSIKVNGDSSDNGAFKETDPVFPVGPYAETKREAEKLVEALATGSIRSSVLRPPLVYGEGVKANMAQLIALVRRLPILPLGDVSSQRSYISVRNLTDALLVLVMGKPKKAYQNEVFFISDGPALTLPDLCQLIACSLNKKLMLFKVPVPILKLFSRLVGKREMFDKLTSSLAVEDRNLYTQYGWTPPHSMAEEISLMTGGR